MFKIFKQVLVYSFIIFIVCIVGLGIVYYDPSPIGYWRTEVGKNAYVQTYNEAMQLLPHPTQTLDIATSFGTVRVYKWPNTDSATAILFIPGRSAGVPMWSHNLYYFTPTHTVYALDVLGDAGMSVQTKKIENGDDQAAWLHEVLTALKISKIHMAGHSAGGWLAANYASKFPKKVASLILMEPIFVLQKIKTSTILKSIPASLSFLPKKWREKTLEDIGDGGKIDYKDPVARMIVEGTEYYAQKLPGWPELITAEQLQSWQMPVYIGMGERSVMHDSDEAVKVAKKNIKYLQVKNWVNGTHSLPMEFSNDLNREILTFITTRANHK